MDRDDSDFRCMHSRLRTCESSSRSTSSLVIGLTLRIRSTGVTNCVTSKAACPVGSMRGKCPLLDPGAGSIVSTRRTHEPLNFSCHLCKGFSHG
jgi:hypothetical protein